MFHYDTIDRDCTSVPKDDSAYSDGCHDADESQGAVSSLIGQTYEGLGLGDVSFDGTSCYSRGDWVSYTQSLSGTANKHSMVPAVLLAITVISTIIIHMC